MWGIDGKVTSPLIRTTLRVVGAGAGNVWHTQRNGELAEGGQPTRHRDAG